MNKRIKKKRILKEITELRSIIERNAQAANSEIESLRSEIELLKKSKKKSFFNRK